MTPCRRCGHHHHLHDHDRTYCGLIGCGCRAYIDPSRWRYAALAIVLAIVLLAGAWVRIAA